MPRTTARHNYAPFDDDEPSIFRLPEETPKKYRLYMPGRMPGYMPSDSGLPPRRRGAEEVFETAPDSPELIPAGAEFDYHIPKEYTKLSDERLDLQQSHMGHSMFSSRFADEATKKGSWKAATLREEAKQNRRTLMAAPPAVHVSPPSNHSGDSPGALPTGNPLMDSVKERQRSRANSVKESIIKTHGGGVPLDVSMRPPLEVKGPRPLGEGLPVASTSGSDTPGPLPDPMWSSVVAKKEGREKWDVTPDTRPETKPESNWLSHKPRQVHLEVGLGQEIVGSVVSPGQPGQAAQPGPPGPQRGPALQRGPVRRGPPMVPPGNQRAPPMSHPMANYPIAPPSDETLHGYGHPGKQPEPLHNSELNNPTTLPGNPLDSVRATGRPDPSLPIASVSASDDEQRVPPVNVPAAAPAPPFILPHPPTDRRRRQRKRQPNPPMNPNAFAPAPPYNQPGIPAPPGPSGPYDFMAGENTMTRNGGAPGGGAANPQAPPVAAPAVDAAVPAVPEVVVDPPTGEDTPAQDLEKEEGEGYNWRETHRQLILEVMERQLGQQPLIGGDRPVPFTPTFIFHVIQAVLLLVLISLCAYGVAADTRTISQGYWIFLIFMNCLLEFVLFMFIFRIMAYNHNNGIFYTITANVLCIIGFGMACGVFLPASGKCVKKTLGLCTNRRAVAAFTMIVTLLWVINLTTFLTVWFISRLNMLPEINTDLYLIGRYGLNLSRSWVLSYLTGGPPSADGGLHKEKPLFEGFDQSPLDKEIARQLMEGNKYVTPGKQLILDEQGVVYEVPEERVKGRKPLLLWI